MMIILFWLLISMEYNKNTKMPKPYRFAGSFGYQLFVKTDEFRPPKKGEFFLSGGAIPQVYRSVLDMEVSYYIMKEATKDEIFCPCCGKKRNPEE